MKNRMYGALAGVGVLALSLSACAGAGGGDGGDSSDGSDVTITLASPSFSQMKDMESLIPEFEAAHPGIKVNVTFLEESDLRDAVTKDVATKGGQYDIVTIGSYETPIWAANGWLTELGPYAQDSEDYDVDDIFEPVLEGSSYDDRMYSAPFYGESSFLMYRPDLFEAAGLTMPENPTWEEVAAFARQLHDPGSGVSGIILRGKPGWGEVLAPLNTVINTMGGQWFDTDWNATLDSPEVQESVQFYVDLLNDAGQPDPVSYGFAESLNLFSQGKAAMWYDSTSAGGIVESSDIGGQVGYVHAPTELTDESGWFWSWNLAIPETSKKKDAAWEFVAWATGKEYVQLVGENVGWEQVPPGTRYSTYEIPEYLERAAAFGPLTKDVMLAVNPKQPGIKPQNWVGVQYVGIPQFQDIGNRISQLFADTISGGLSVPDFLQQAQAIAQPAGDEQK